MITENNKMISGILASNNRPALVREWGVNERIKLKKRIWNLTNKIKVDTFYFGMKEQLIEKIDDPQERAERLKLLVSEIDAANEYVKDEGEKIEKYGHMLD